MITDSFAIISLVLAIIWLVPLVCRKIHIPAIVGFIVMGIIIGEHGIGLLFGEHDSGLLAPNRTIDVLGKMGMLYIMLQAGIEIDMNDFRQYRWGAVVFGIYTFVIPFAFGLLVARLMGMSWQTSALLGAMFGSHTLMTYPIVNRYGVQQSAAVNMTVGATMLAITLSLLVLAVLKSRLLAGDGWEYWWTLAGKTALLGIMTFGVFPNIAKWFFRHNQNTSAGFAMVMLMLVASAGLADWAGLEAILGAFLCGVALNKWVPNLSPLMGRINFVGNTIFVPLFLLGVGMMIDVRLVVAGWGTVLIAAVMIVTKYTSKWLASWAAQRSFHLQALERELMFGLTHATAAGTLAIVTIGYKVGLFDITILNGTVVMILVLCTSASFVTEHAAKELALQEEARLESERTEDQWLVMQVAEQKDDALLTMAKLSQLPEPEFVTAVDWQEAEQFVERSGKSVVIYHEQQPLNTINRLLVAVPRYAEKERDFISCFGQIRRLSSQIGAKVVFYCNDDTKRPLQALCARPGKYLRASYRELTDWEDVLQIAKHIRRDNMLVMIQARHATPSYNPLFSQVPRMLREFFGGYSTLLLYPEQLTRAEVQDVLLADIPQPSAIWRIVSSVKEWLLTIWRKPQKRR
ncbi:MAG: cation:proton antiporter [Paludibacteraceae bacterium]|nr:cation:proton antiporter [Paludibacteraceae bacterium]